MPTEPLKQSLELVESLSKRLPVDEKRLYITGLSMGGFGVWDAMQRHPDRFAAAVIICGGGDPAYAKQIKDIPIWAFHGGSDPAVDQAAMERYASWLEQQREDGIVPPEADR